MDKLRYPGSAATVETIADSATMAPEASIWNALTFLMVDALAQSGTLEITAAEAIRKGDKVVVICADCNGYNITFDGDAAGVGMMGGSDGVVETVELVWDGTAFVKQSGPEAIQNVSLSVTGTLAITANAGDVFVEGTPTGAVTINITAGDQLRKGNRLHIKTTGDASTYTVTLGTAIDAAAIVNVNGKTKCQSFVWNGSAYVAMGAVAQID